MISELKFEAILKLFDIENKKETSTKKTNSAVDNPFESSKNVKSEDELQKFEVDDSSSDDKTKEDETKNSNSNEEKIEVKIGKNGVEIDKFKDFFEANKKLDEVLKEYGYDKLFDEIDANGDGTVTNDELEKLGEDFSLEDFVNFSDDDVEKLAEKLGIEIQEERSVDELKKLIEQKLKEAKKNNSKTSNTTPTASTVNSAPTYSSSSSSYSSGSSTGAEASNSGGLEVKTMEELKTEKAEKQKDVDSANDDIKEVHSGENENVKKAVLDADKKEEAYNKALEKDDKVSDELKEKQKTNQEKIDKSEENINKLEGKITDDKAKITKLESQISLKEGEISALKSSLSALPEKTKENKDNWADIDAKEQELKGLIETEEKKLKSLKSDKKDAEALKKTHKTSLDKEKETLDKLKEERKKIEDEILDSCSEETKMALEAWQTARENIETVKADELKKAQEALSTAQGELDKVNNAIDELKQAQIAAEHSMNQNGEKVAEMGLSFNNMSASQMQSIMTNAGCAFHDGQWCADFATFITKQVYGNDVPGNLLSECSNLASCYGYGTWAQSKGILMDSRTTQYDKSQVKAGDYILYNADEAGEWYHIGIVSSVDNDGTIHTIEGNTNGGAGSVGAHTIEPNRTDVSFVLMNKLK